MGNVSVEFLWGVICAVLVLFLHVGTASREAGFAAISKHQLTKQTAGFAVSALAFWAVGYGVMVGNAVNVSFAVGTFFPRIISSDTPFFLFQLLLCTTLTSLLATAAAQRLSIAGHLLLTAMVGGLLFPTLARLGWYGNGLLVQWGYIDRAGSTIIFGAASAVLLGVLLVMGLPRSTGEPPRRRDSGAPFVALSVWLLAIGWLGLAGGHFTFSPALIGMVTINVLSAGVAGLLAGTLFSWHQSGRYQIEMLANGSLAALIAVLAGVHVLPAFSAVVVGIVAGLLGCAVVTAVAARHLQEVAYSGALYAVSALWGTVAVALLAPASLLPASKASQLVVQLLGFVVVCGVAFGGTAAFLLLLRRLAARHMASAEYSAAAADPRHDSQRTYTDLLAVLQAQSETGDLTLRAPEDDYSEFGRIAQTYNRVIEKLEQTNHQSETIIRSAMDGIVTIRQSDLTIMQMNPAAETIFGQHIDGMRDVALGDLIDLTSLQDARSILDEALRTGHAFQFSAVNFAGTQFPIEAVVSEALLHGEPVYIATFRDITERNQAKEKLEELNRKLVEASRQQDAFVAAMSHELRTPLNAILGMSQALSANVYGQLDARQRNATEKITDSGRHLLELIDDILDLSKINADEQVVEKHSLPVSYICKAALSMVQPQADAKQIRIRRRYDPQVVTVEADARRLKQILINLLNNAIKFTPHGGRVGLMVVGAPSSNEVHFIVWDNGIGIPKARHADLFQPFVQLDNSPARRYGGVGLGLALVKELVELHSGRIRLLSEEGQGSRFIVTLPWPPYLQASEEPQLSIDELTQLGPHPFRPNTEPQIESMLSGRNLLLPTILLADDNEANLSTLSDYLTLRGYQIATARNGSEAIEMALNEAPDLLLLNLEIADVDGTEVIERLRAQPHLADMPILVLSSRLEPGTRERCLALGASDFRGKPIGLPTLVQAIEAQLEGVHPLKVGTLSRTFQ